MGIKSKLICISVTGALLLSMTVSSFAAVSGFNDLKDVGAKDKILTLKDKGVVHGTGRGNFSPKEPVTAVQGVQLIVNAFNLNLDFVKFAREPKATDYFVKADNNAWYARGLIIAAVNSMQLPGDLDPAQKWTREEFTHWLIQTMESHYYLPTVKIAYREIADQKDITPEYEGQIQRAILYKVVSLDSNGQFNPKAEITRAEAAEEIYNALKYIEARAVEQTQE
ncbi:S-layer homology domain-containing protein [Ruminiclostridium papyrosolvens]|uniref:S-layer protein n=1 Tax=Ruminiclostridium papyrosolvens C7 TaxID=1330534 RepID=U4QXX9_9FIRM|nr:S-layer homology domain-containing protein [Ruminiclostridium papyrosolvens]EPR09407.1 S-layer protein [Ruminiclostridium papyrosolvens C7]